MSHIKDRLSSYHDWMQDIVNRYKLVTARDFLEMIEQLQEDLEQDEKENGWIPVSERLPEDEKEYFVTLEKVYGTPDTFFGIANYLKFGDAGYWNEKNTDTLNGINIQTGTAERRCTKLSPGSHFQNHIGRIKWEDVN